MPSVNRIFPLRVLTAGAIGLFLNITGAIAPIAPVLNTPLQDNPECVSFVFWKNQSHHNLLSRFTDL